jgi:hypothetical protein
MIMETKLKRHGIRKLFFDILRDTDSTKYSLTKFASLVGLLLLVTTVIMSLIVMWKTQVVDHVLLVELIGFVLTLLGFKNNFGFKGKEGQTIAGDDCGETGKTDPNLEEQKMSLSDNEKDVTPLSDKTNDSKG